MDLIRDHFNLPLMLESFFSSPPKDMPSSSSSSNIQRAQRRMNEVKRQNTVVMQNRPMGSSTPTPTTPTSTISQSVQNLALGTDPNSRTTTTQAGAPASGSATLTTSGSSTSSLPPLFPDASQSSSSSSSGGGGTNVYYLVFLGVLVVLLGIAACLTYRAFRMRRRYRTATQRAIARGGPLPPGMFDDRNDYWGLGGFAGWTSDGMDRFGLPATHPGLGFAGGATHWNRIPSLSEHVVDKEDVDGPSTAQDSRWNGGFGWDNTRSRAQTNKSDWTSLQPLMIHSLREEEDDYPTLDPFADRQSPRTAGPRPRPIPRISLSPLLFPNRRRQRQEAEDMAREQAAMPERIEEIDREVEDGEPVRVGVIIEMPSEHQDDHHGASTGLSSNRRAPSSLDDDENEEIGWKPGMELGVWEGVVSDHSR